MYFEILHLRIKSVSLCSFEQTLVVNLTFKLGGCRFAEKYVLPNETSNWSVEAVVFELT